MNQDLLRIIKDLSLSDKKTLSQKVLKATEELGELAKAILPIDDAHATRHRFADKHKALEEISDTILCLMSVGYDLGFDAQDIENMIWSKTKVWAGLQEKESLLDTNRIPFEIHVTVANASVVTFTEACKILNVKPILLELHMKNDFEFTDMMTSSTFVGTNKQAYEEMKIISAGLSQHGLEVIREKIETVPWHPAAPSEKFPHLVMPKNCYFESHLNVKTNRDRLDELSAIAALHGAKRSSNILRKDGYFVKIMVTLRSADSSYEQFSAALQVLKDSLVEKDFLLEKEIVEFSVFDTKVSHDASWISNG